MAFQTFAGKMTTWIDPNKPSALIVLEILQTLLKNANGYGEQNFIWKATVSILYIPYIHLENL